MTDDVELLHSFKAGGGEDEEVQMVAAGVNDTMRRRVV